MNKLGAFTLIICIAIIIGGVYGMLHDELTYTISPEYYTKFKFYQFGLMDAGNEAVFPNPRIEVAAVGFMATWWMGIPIGLVLGLVGLIHRDWKAMLFITVKALLFTIIIAFITGLTGLAYGHLVLSKQPKATFDNWYLPDNLIDFKNFIKVGSMHNFSYLGGLTGLVGGIIYSVRKRNSKNSQLLR